MLIFSAAPSMYNVTMHWRNTILYITCCAADIATFFNNALTKFDTIYNLLWGRYRYILFPPSCMHCTMYFANNVFCNMAISPQNCFLRKKQIFLFAFCLQIFLRPPCLGVRVVLFVLMCAVECVSFFLGASELSDSRVFWKKGSYQYFVWIKCLSVGVHSWQLAQVSSRRCLHV
jgi:hypothetical protein